MGSCASKLTEQQKQEKAASKKIDEKAAKDFEQEIQIFKLLLLGAGESGKSTLFKQMVTIYGSGYTHETLQTYQSVVRANVISSVKILVEMSDELSKKGIEGTTISPELEDSKQAIISADEHEFISSEIPEHIQKLWSDPGIKKTYSCRSMYQLPGPGDYFFVNIDRIGASDYCPTYDDILRTRVRTTGIIETEFVIDEKKFKMFDVGGQRNERKKWIHCFENVTAVLFVVAISEYDEKLFEDETIARMAESMKLFDEICNARWFKKTSMILFLNKVDLFKEKIKIKSIKEYFNEYSGPENDWESASDYIKKQFIKLNTQTGREVYAHVTCATDNNNVKHVMSAVTDIIIKKSLEEGGLLM